MVSLPNLYVNDSFAFQGLGVPAEVGLLLVHKSHLWLDVLPPVTNDSHGYQQELNPGLLRASLSH